MLRFKRAEWSVAYRKKDVIEGLPSLDAPFYFIKNPWWGWTADPFLFEYSGKTYLFAELFSWRKNRGFLGYCLLENGNFGPWKTAIQENYNLSYPNIFEQNGEIYLCPEARQSQEIYFYRAVEFPNRWERCAAFVKDIGCVDTTFYDKDGEVYGFTCARKGVTQNELLLFRFIDKKRNEIEFSPENPISEDESSLRMGGNFIYTRNGDYRVSQDCHRAYGEALVFSKVDLNWPHYQEEVVLRISPDRVKVKECHYKISGIHTYNRLNNIEVVDIKFFRFNILGIMNYLFYGILKAFKWF